MTPNADLHLRGGVRAQVSWPSSTAARPPLLVVVTGDGRLGAELAARIPAVVLTAAADGAREALEWGADHAAELGADPGRIALAGEHRGATAIAALAREARDRGWPAIAHIVLFDPRATAVDALVGLFRVALRMPGATRAGTREASAPAGRARAAGPARPRGGRR
jgi:carboxylesterase type B